MILSSVDSFLIGFLGFRLGVSRFRFDLSDERTIFFNWTGLNSMFFAAFFIQISDILSLLCYYNAVHFLQVPIMCKERINSQIYI